MDHIAVANHAVEIARRLGAFQTEAYVLDSKALTVEVCDQKLETLKLANDVGIGIRIISQEGKVGFAYSSEISPDKLERLAAQAIGNCHKSFADQYNGLPTQTINIPGQNLADSKIGTVTVEEKIEMARKVEIAARKADKRVTRTERCTYEDAEYGISLANSNGLSVYYRSGYCGLYGIVLAEQENDVQTGMAINYARDFDALDPYSVGQEAARDSVMLLGAKSIATTKATLVLSPYIATNFFAIIIPALCADAVQKGRSLFKNKIGKRIASPLVNIVDDGQLDKGIASAPFDGEGVPTDRTNLIVDGVLESYLYNTYTAAKDNVQSTGNGVRNSFKSMPEVGPTNIYISPGNTSREKVIGEVKNGFYVTNVMGMHTANPISGDFSIGAAGVWIKNGEFCHAVRGVAIAGNIIELLSEVDAVADDLRFFGAQGAPTVRITSISISGM